MEEDMRIESKRAQYQRISYFWHMFQIQFINFCFQICIINVTTLSQYFVIRFMSYIIDQDQFYFEKISVKQSFFTTFNNTPTQSQAWLKKCRDGLTDGFRREGITNYSQYQHSNIWIAYALVPKAFYRFNGLVSFKFFRKQNSFQVEISLLDNSNNLLTVKSFAQRILACRQLNVQHTKFQKDMIKLTMNLDNGHLKIRMPLYHSDKNYIMCFLGLAKRSFFYNLLDQITKRFCQSLTKIAKYLPMDKLDQCIQQNGMPITKYLNMLNVKISFAQRQAETEQQSNQRDEQQNFSIIKIKQNKIKQKKLVYQSLQLYLNSPQTLNISYALTYKERQDIKDNITIPYPPQSRNIHDNNSVLNNIQIQDPSVLSQPYKLTEGGFADILCCKIKCWYLLSTEQKNENSAFLTPEKLLTKIVAIKRQHISDKRYKSRNQHEKTILAQIKNGTTIFLTKYYFPLNHYTYPNDLLMDYISFIHLQGYVQLSKHTMSLPTKLHIIFMLSLALRYLRDYKIVHFDLKPTNIMVCYNLITKIIDFGQSYHPSVCQRNFRPGFSLPYSCPQIHYPQPIQFSSKNDIYSLGIMLHELIYQRFPFPFHNLAHYKQKRYINYCYDIPEAMNEFGDSQSIPILNFLITKCLSPNPQDRPELEWISLILRRCIDFYG